MASFLFHLVFNRNQYFLVRFHIFRISAITSGCRAAISFSSEGSISRLKSKGGMCSVFGFAPIFGLGYKMCFISTFADGESSGSRRTKMDMVVKTNYIPVPVETVLSGSFFKNPSGKGAKQAVIFARLDGNISFISNCRL